MALTVEDGSGLSTANSYATVERYKAFAKARGVTPPSVAAECEVLLTKAWDGMLGLDYKGTRFSRTQGGDFPRVGVVIDGFAYATTEIPSFVPDGQCALALAAQQGVNLQPTLQANTSGPIIERTVGPVTTRFAESGRANQRPIIEHAQGFLRKVLRNAGGLRIERA